MIWKSLMLSLPGEITHSELTESAKNIKWYFGVYYLTSITFIQGDTIFSIVDELKNN